jgi:hypothetical protein
MKSGPLFSINTVDILILKLIQNILDLFPKKNYNSLSGIGYFHNKFGKKA